MSLFNKGICALVVILSVLLSFSGCANIPLKEGGLEIAKDTTAGIDDIGVGRLTKQF